MSRVVRRLRCSAVSLPELLIVIAVIGILAAIAIPNISGLRRAASREFSSDAVEVANRAVMHYEQANRPLGVEPAAGSADEAEVLAALTTVDPDVPGSPFLEPSFPTESDNSSDTYRMVWNGARFELLLPGQVGTGILLTTNR